MAIICFSIVITQLQHQYHQHMYITDLSYIELVEIEYPIPLRQSGYMLSMQSLKLLGMVIEIQESYLV